MMTNPLLRTTLSLLLWAAAIAPLPARAQEAQPTAAAADPAIKEVQVAAEAFTRGTPMPDWAMPLVPPPPTQRTNPVVIRLAESQLLADGAQSVLVHRATQVNDKTSLGVIGQYPLHFVPQYQKLNLHQVQILRGAEAIDHTATVSVRFLERETGLESGIYSGTVTAMLLLEDVRVGDTLRIVYSVEGHNPVFGNAFSDTASWDQGEATELRRVTLLYTPPRSIDWRLHGDHRPTRIRPETVSHGTRRGLRFEERALEPIEEEPSMPPDYFGFRFLQFSEHADWGAVAQWATTLFPAGATLPDELQPVLQRLRQLPTPQERAAAALQWVQDEIRYFSVSLGESSHRPYAPAQVVQRRYGDCKDKTYLLVTLLRELGMDAHPVLVSSRFMRAPARMLPNPEIFDHVIAQVRIGEATYFLDGTRIGQRGQLARMGAVLPGASGLVVGAATRELIQLSSPNAMETATNELREEFTLDNLGGDGKLLSRQVWHGSTAEVLRLVLGRLTPEQRRKEAASPYDRRYPGIRLDGEPVLLDDTERNTLTLESRFTVPGLAKEFSGDYIMRFFPNNVSGVISLPQKMDRNFPAVVAGVPYRARYEMTMRWPDVVISIMDPSTQRVATDFFQAEVHRTFRGNVATMSMTYTPRVETVVPKDLPRLVEDLRKLERAIGGYVAIDRAQIKNTGFLGLNRPTASQAMVTRLDKVIERTGQTIADGRLSGDDLAEALCDRAEALADRGRPAEGLTDAAEAVRIAPELGRAWHCRGNMHFANAEFARAITDFTKGMTLGADPFMALYRRGHARFYQGQFEQAAQDFAKAADGRTNRDDESDTAFAQMWQVWSLQRAGKPLPQDLLDAGQRAAGGAWPRPALAMVVGVLSPEQVLALVEKKQGDERELTLAEAWFYIGQYHQSQGELPRAREAFQKAQGMGITMYVEHVAAGFELARLK
jgi:lipoprotein NlpI